MVHSGSDKHERIVIILIWPYLAVLLIQKINSKRLNKIRKIIHFSLKGRTIRELMVGGGGGGGIFGLQEFFGPLSVREFFFDLSPMPEFF